MILAREQRLISLHQQPVFPHGATLTFNARGKHGATAGIVVWAAGFDEHGSWQLAAGIRVPVGSHAAAAFSSRVRVGIVGVVDAPFGASGIRPLPLREMGREREEHSGHGPGTPRVGAARLRSWCEAVKVKPLRARQRGAADEFGVPRQK